MQLCRSFILSTKRSLTNIQISHLLREKFSLLNTNLYRKMPSQQYHIVWIHYADGHKFDANGNRLRILHRNFPLFCSTFTKSSYANGQVSS